MGRVGYCPQFDAITEQMSVEETLALYGALRGIPDAVIPTLARQLITSLALTNHRHKMAGEHNLRGGGQLTKSDCHYPRTRTLPKKTSDIDRARSETRWKIHEHCSEFRIVPFLLPCLLSLWVVKAKVLQGP